MIPELSIHPPEAEHFLCVACGETGPQVDEDSKTCQGACQAVWAVCLSVAQSYCKLNRVDTVDMADRMAQGAMEAMRLRYETERRLT